MPLNRSSGFSPKSNLINLAPDPQCIVIATGGNLGGAIVSMPLIKAVKDRWPNAYLIVISSTQHGLDITKLSDAADSFYLAPARTVFRSLFDKDVKTFRNNLKRHSPDIFISNFDFDSNYLMLPLSIPIRIGHVGESIYGDPIPWEGMFNIPVSCKRGTNWLDSYSHLAKTFQTDMLPQPKLNISPRARDEAKKFLMKSNLKDSERPIAIQAGVWKKQLFKQWPLESLVAVCTMLFEEHELVPVIIGASGEEKIIEMLHEVLPSNKIIDFVGKTTPEQAAALVNECSACIANDSGLMHLSAAIGTPTVFISSVSDLTWIYGDSITNRIVRNNSCTPCFAINRELPNQCTRPCLTHVYPETVIKAVLEVI